MAKLEKLTLENGLRVVVDTDYTTSLVSMCIAYDVGARDEDPARTGFAHLFEHLMFGGSINIPSYDAALDKAGGINNAFTSQDVTCFYCQVPWANLEVPFWLESDRMLSLAFTPESLQVQRNVVVEEFKQTALNEPYGDSTHLLLRLLYREHPYQWPTLGKCIEHIEAATMDDVKSFFYRHYAPNNAVLALSGHVDVAQAHRLAEKWFGPIARRAVPRRALPSEPPLEGQRRLRVQRNVPYDALSIAFPMVALRDSRYATFDMLSDILANGKSARLEQRLKEERQLFSNIDATVSGLVDPGFFLVSGTLHAGVSMEEGERAIFEELAGLQDVHEEELRKVQSKFAATRVFERMNIQNRAEAYSRWELLGGAELWDAEVAQRQAVTVEELREEALRSFVPENSAVLEYQAEREEEV